MVFLVFPRSAFLRSVLISNQLLMPHAEDIERTRPLYPEEQESLQENGGGDILV
jgi:hypothetical protein